MVKKQSAEGSDLLINVNKYLKGECKKDGPTLFLVVSSGRFWPHNTAKTWRNWSEFSREPPECSRAEADVLW